MRFSHDKEIVFIRHGAVPKEFAEKYIGQDSVPLSEIGVNECEMTGRFLAKWHFDAAYCGTLVRVQQTVQHVRHYAPQIPVPIPDERLNEINFGDWGLCSFQEIAQKDPEGYNSWSLGNYGYAFPEGESIQDFATRTRAFLNEILATEAQKIAIFSHGGVIMALIADLTFNHRDNAFNTWIERGGIARVIVRTDGTGRLNLMLKPAEFFHDGSGN